MIFIFQSTVSVFPAQSRPSATNNTILQSQTTSAQSQYSLSIALVTLVLQSALQILITPPRSLRMGNYNIDNTPLVNPREALTCLFNTFYTNIAQAIRNSFKYLKDLNCDGTKQKTVGLKYLIYYKGEERTRESIIGDRS